MLRGKLKNKSRTTIISFIPLTTAARNNIKFLRSINWPESLIENVIKDNTEAAVFSTTKSKSGKGHKYVSNI